MTTQELIGSWDRNGTPSVEEFRAAYEQGDNIWWMVGCGHHQNLFESACEEIDRLRAVNEAQAQQLAAANAVVGFASGVMSALDEYGPGIVGHLLDTDDNDGQRLREAVDDFFAVKRAVGGSQ